MRKIIFFCGLSILLLCVSAQAHMGSGFNEGDINVYGNTLRYSPRSDDALTPNGTNELIYYNKDGVLKQRESDGTITNAIGGTGDITAVSAGGLLSGGGTTGAVTLKLGVIDISDSATVSGTLRHENGGLEADVSGYSGIIAVSGGNTSEVDTFSELDTQIADKTLINEEDAPTFDNTVTHDGSLVSNSNLSISENASATGVLYPTLMDENGDVKGRTATAWQTYIGAGGSGTINAGTATEVGVYSAGTTIDGYPGFQYDQSADILKLTGDLSANGDLSTQSALFSPEWRGSAVDNDIRILPNDDFIVVAADFDVDAGGNVTVSGDIAVGINYVSISGDLTVSAVQAKRGLVIYCDAAATVWLPAVDSDFNFVEVNVIGAVAVNLDVNV